MLLNSLSLFFYLIFFLICYHSYLYRVQMLAYFANTLICPKFGILNPLKESFISNFNLDPHFILGEFIGFYRRVKLCIFI